METKTMLIYVKCLFLTGPSWEFSFAVLFLHRQFIAQISGFAQLMALLAGVLIPFLSLGYSLLYICPIYVLYMSCICPIYVLFMSYIYIERERELKTGWKLKVSTLAMAQQCGTFQDAQSDARFKVAHS